MNASIKKLLSMLVVMAMVFSMVPTFTLPAAALTPPADPGKANLTTEQAAEVQRGKDVQTAANAIVIPTEGTTFDAECPVCKKTVTWTKKTGAIGGITANGNYHYVWQGEINVTNSTYNWISSSNRTDTTVCVLMRDAVLTGGGTIMNTGSGVVMNLMGTGTLTSDGTKSEGYGLLKANATLNLYGGTYIYTGNCENATTKNVDYGTLKVNGTAATTNIYADAVIGGDTQDNTVASYNALVFGGKLNMYGGTIQNGVSAVQIVSGNVTVANNGTFNMYGGEIKNGCGKVTDGTTQKVDGGNVRVGSKLGSNTTVTAGTFNMYGGTITGGTAQYGGNVHTDNKGVCLISGGTISNGHATTHGGNLSVGTGGDLKVMGGDIYGGTAGAQAGNIRSWQAPLEIGGTAYIHDGTASGTNVNHNVWVQGSSATSGHSLTISGGTIAGDVLVGNGPLTLKGAPVIGKGKSIGLRNSGDKADVSGLTAGADIALNKLTLGAIISTACATAEDAARIAGYFTCEDGTLKVAAAEDNTLKIVENKNDPVEGVFDPEGCGGKAYCPVCKAVKDWTPYAGENYSEATVLKNGPHHLYLAKDVTYESGKSFLVAWTNVCLNLNGHDITAVEGAKYAFSVSQTLNLMDTEGGAVVTGYQNSNGTGATLHANGGNASAKYNLYGGTYTKLAADTKSAIVQIGSNGGTITMYEGATIDASGKSVSLNAVGCAVQLAGSTGKNAVFNMEGGEIIGGTGVNGGAVQIGAYSNPQIYDCAVFNMKGGKVHGGTASAAGGNFSVQYGGTLNISGGSLYSGHVSSNASGSNWGGNIRAWNANVNISGGLIYGGTGGKQLNGANVSVYSDADGRTGGRGKLTISGGTIVGDVAVTNGAEDILALSGAPKIVTSMVIDDVTYTALTGGLHIGTGNAADITGLTTEADIALSTSKGMTISKANANAAQLVGCFKPTDSTLIVEAQADNTLKVVEHKPVLDKFEPEKFDGMAYCPVCYANGKHTEPVEWTAITSSTTAFQLSPNGHFYIKEDIKNASVYVGETKKDAYIQGAGGGSSNICCLNLNGKELTVTDGRAIFASNAVFNIMDTEGGAVVSGNQTSVGNACTLLLNSSRAGSTVNIYGGTFTKAATNTKSSIVSIQGNGGTINMYGGCIDGTGCTTDNYPTGVYLVGGIYDATNYPHNGLATFNMYGGEIKGGTVATTLNANNKVLPGNGGNILVGDYNGAAVRKGCATFNMYGGSVYGGHADVDDNNNGGGNIALTNGGVMNMYNDAKVYGGTVGSSEKLKGNAGNILVNVGATLNMYDNSEVYNGSAGNQGGNIRIWKGDFNMYGNAKVYGGHAYGSNTHNVWVVCSDMTMTDNAVVYGKGTSTNNAITVSAYGDNASNMIISTLTLSGNATVKNETGTSNNAISLNWTLTNNADATDDGVSKLFITNDWTGEAHIYALKNNGVAEGASKTTLVSYTAGSTIDESTAVCGTLAQDGTFTKGGSFSGKLYFSGNIGTIGENGDVIIGAASIDGADGDSWYKSNQAALDAYYANGSFAKNEHLVVGGNTTMTMNGDIIIESRGFTVTLDGTGTVYMLDRANDDYEGYGVWKVSGDVKVASEATNSVNDNRYISLKHDNGNYSAHRFEMKLTHVTLRTNAGGMYYKAKIMCDNMLAGRVNGYGVVVSRQDMPGVDFMDEAEGSNGFTMYEKLTPNAEHTVTTTSGSLFNIVKDPSVVVEGEKVRTPEQNDANIEEKVYANLYLSVDRLDTGILDDCEYFVADNKNCGTQNGIAFSLLQVVSMINDNWSAYNETQQTLVKSTITTWGSWLTSAKANALLAELDKIFA